MRFLTVDHKEKTQIFDLVELYVKNQRAILLFFTEHLEQLTSNEKNVLQDSIKYYLHFADYIQKKTISALLVNVENSIYSIIADTYTTKVNIVIEAITFKESRKILGKSFDFCLLDLRLDFSPNAICRIVETVNGGGFICLILTKEDIWIHSVPQFYKEMGLVTKNKEETFVSFLKKHFLTTLRKFSNIFVLNEALSFNRNFETQQLSVKKDNLNENIDGYPCTADQKHVITQLLAELTKTKNFTMQKRDLFLIVANRGRGKSATLGILLGKLVLNSSFSTEKTQNAKKHPLIYLTAPHIENIQVVFQQLIKYLEFKKIKPKISYTVEGTYISNVEVPITPQKTIRISYKPPKDAIEIPKKSLLFIDEAAAIPPKILQNLIKREKTVMSTTVQGYEGVGRSFSLVFLKNLEKSANTQIVKFEMKIPIRFSENDPIEKWLFETFFLDAEPHTFTEKLRQTILEKPFNTILHLEIPSKDNLFHQNFLPTLKETIGIYITSHYRNQPNDLLFLADSSSHFLVIGYYLDVNSNRKIPIAAIQCSVEGPITEEHINELKQTHTLKGNLIPTMYIREYGLKYKNLQGIRIVRIAVHPELQNNGIGSFFLSQLVLYLTEKKTTTSWIGSSFGATPILLRFWHKNNFKLVHLRPTANTTTGEHSVVVIKALPTFNDYDSTFSHWSAMFRVFFIENLRETLYQMDDDLVFTILNITPPLTTYPLVLTQSAKVRLINYLEGTLNYFMALDAIRILCTWFFIANDPNNYLTRAQQKLIINKVLKAKTWNQVQSDIKKPRAQLFMILLRTIKKIWKVAETENSPVL